MKILAFIVIYVVYILSGFEIYCLALYVYNRMNKILTVFVVSILD